MIQPTRLFATYFFPAIVLTLAAGPAMAETVTLDDLTLSPNSYFNGPAANAQPITENDTSNGELGTFASGSPAPVQFVNNYDSDYQTWSGFAYSNVDDTLDGSYTNQYAAYPGVGAGPGVDGAADNYAVGFGYLDLNPNPYTGQNFAFDPTDPTALTAAQLAAWLPELMLPSGYQIQSLEVANTTYAYLSMAEGLNGVTQFGANDFFKLDIYGSNAQGQVLSNYYTYDLANGTNIVSTWNTLNLASTLAGATTLYFEMVSSQNSPVVEGYSPGMITPGYFALDNVVIQPVPEPSSLGLMAAAACGLMAVARRLRGAQRRATNRGIIASRNPSIPQGASNLP